MAESSLKDRLREHSEAFDGLLSLIPAKFYYGEDTSDQWKKKKQTKEQAAAARRAKLDPDSATAKSAKDVMDERVRKRKIDELEEEEESDIEGVEKELPKQGLKLAQEKANKKPKLAKKENEPATSAAAEESKPTSEEKELKKQQKQEKKKEKKERQQQKKASKQQKDTENIVELPAEDKDAVEELVESHEAENDEDLPSDEMAPFEAEGLEERPEEQTSTSQPSPAPSSPPFDNGTEPSSNTSVSSVPPATAPRHIKLPADPEALRAKLNARIEALRAARKADGPDGKPARNRAELLEARRKKEEQRRAHKKELRMKAREEEDARREAALASARNSPASGMMSPHIHSPEHNFSFGRVSFGDGQTLSNDMSGLKEAPRKKGPQDPATALAASEKKRLRLAGLDDEKRADIEEKDVWLNAKKRANGEKVRDDTSLLKKTLKRKEKMKKKSEKEWNERKEGIAKSQAMKQKKREDNLQKRRDGKGTKGKGSKGKTVSSKKPKVKSRPGFEGSFGSGKRK